MHTDNKPRLVFWEVTKGCNLRCIHCRATATELSSPTDLPTEKALAIIHQIAEFSNPILVLSGGEPLFRRDIFQLARYGTDRGLRVALATNGTLVTRTVAKRIVDSGVRRVSMSLDGADADTHDSFRGIPGAFENTLQGFRNLQELGMSLQINMTVARHNAHQLPAVLELARNIGADALHTFLLVPVGCGVDIAAEQMVPPEEYEQMLNWFYDQSKNGDIELKATCAPHYFRVAKQRQVEERKAAQAAILTETADPSAIGPTDTLMPSGTGIVLNPTKRPAGHPGGTSRRHERRHQGLPGRHRRMLYFARRRGLSLWLSAGEGRRPAPANLRRSLDRFTGVRATARYRQLEGEVRVLRIPQHLHGMSRARLRRHRRHAGRGTVLRLPAAHDQCARISRA